MMARPRKNPDDPKWTTKEEVLADIQNVGTSVEPPTACKRCGQQRPADIHTCSPQLGNDDLMVAVLMAGYIARGGPLSHETMLRQARELVATIKGAV